MGAELILTDPLEGSDGAMVVARQLANDFPEKYYYADQYQNNNNWLAHYETTGPEIWVQTNRKITHFVAGLGTSGTLTGVTKYLKEQKIETTIGTYCLSGTTFYKNKYSNVQPNALYLENNTITFPCYSGLDLEYIISQIREYT